MVTQRFDSARHHRKSFRLRGFDYTLPGTYFITICTHDRRELFGEIANGGMRLNDAGMAAQAVWRAIPAHFPTVRLDAFVVMPNHVHGVIVIAPTAATTTRGSDAGRASPHNCASPERPGSRGPNVAGTGRPAGPPSCSVGAIVGSYKSAASRRINRLRDASYPPIGPIWQRNYYEVIVRDDGALQRIRAYIVANPRNWNRARCG